MSRRSRWAVVALATLGYAMVWVAAGGLAVAAAFATNTDNPDGSDSWAAIGMGLLGFAVGVLVGHTIWMVVAARMLAPYGHPWRTRVAVIAPPVLLVLVVIARNESLVPWQLWPVALVCVPAVGATWATAP